MADAVNADFSFQWPDTADRRGPVMRQLPALLFVYVILFWPAQLHAATPCDVIDTLSRLQAAVSNRDFPAVRSLNRRSDAEGILWTLRNHPLADASDDIGGLLAMAEHIASQDAPDQAIAATLGSTANRDLLNRLDLLLDTHACRERSLIRVNSNAAGATSASRAPPQSGQPGWKPVRLASIGIAALGGLVGSGLLAYLLLRAHGRRVRLSRRFVVNLPARIGAAIGVSEARLLDLSRQGAKFKIDPEYRVQVADQVTTMFAQLQVEGAIRWRNAHYIGVEFTQPLSPEDFGNLLVIARHES